MQSSYKIIKSSSVVKEGKIDIVTEFDSDVDHKQSDLGEINARMFINSYENLAKSMIENARLKVDKMISDAFDEAQKIEKDAYDNGYEKGFAQGTQNGYNDGVQKAYEEGYENNVNKALQEAEVIKSNADNVLKSALEEKERYVKEKEQELRDLIISCIENILKIEVKDDKALNNVIYEALSQIKNTNTFIIKTRKMYCDELKNNVDLWKEQLPFKGDIFIIPDDSIEEGTVIIERDNGKTVIGVDIAMEKIREIFSESE